MSHNLLSSVPLLSGEILEDPAGIHAAHTEHCEKAFSTPPQHNNGIHMDGWNWETRGTKEEFLVAMDYQKIPS